MKISQSSSTRYLHCYHRAPPPCLHGRSSMVSSPPPSFKCPISWKVMRDPVCCDDGHSYDRPNIEHWLSMHNRSPRTGAELPNKVLTPNHALRMAIEEWLLSNSTIDPRSTENFFAKLVRVIIAASLYSFLHEAVFDIYCSFFKIKTVYRGSLPPGEYHIGVGGIPFRVHLVDFMLVYHFFWFASVIASDAILVIYSSIFKAVHRDNPSWRNVNNIVEGSLFCLEFVVLVVLVLEPNLQLSLLFFIINTVCVHRRYKK